MFYFFRSHSGIEGFLLYSHGGLNSLFVPSPADAKSLIFYGTVVPVTPWKHQKNLTSGKGMHVPTCGGQGSNAPKWKILHGFPRNRIINLEICIAK